MAGVREGHSRPRLLGVLPPPVAILLLPVLGSLRSRPHRRRPVRTEQVLDDTSSAPHVHTMQINPYHSSSGVLVGCSHGGGSRSKSGIEICVNGESSREVRRNGFPDVERLRVCRTIVSDFRQFPDFFELALRLSTFLLRNFISE